MSGLLAFIVYFAAVLITAVGMIGISFFIGQRHQERSTGEAYESGICSVGTSLLRFKVNFYHVAILFVILDLESLFIFIWALTFREAGWTGFIVMLFYILVLLLVVVFFWREGIFKINKRRPLPLHG